MSTICGANCADCGFGKNNGCKGCSETGGCPFGKQCFIASYIKAGGKDYYELFKKQLIDEFNSLKVDGMPEIKELFPLNGAYVNLGYPLPNGKTVKLLDDNDVYLGTQVECEFSDGITDTCYGLVANTNFLLVCEYGENGTNPEIVIYKRR